MSGGLLVVFAIARYNRPRSEEENTERISQLENSNGRVPEPYELGVKDGSRKIQSHRAVSSILTWGAMLLDGSSLYTIMCLYYGTMLSVLDD
nr:hypothetical protein CFP56_76413 [Quercus suber]